jgi:hypothetical protein
MVRPSWQEQHFLMNFHAQHCAQDPSNECCVLERVLRRTLVMHAAFSSDRNLLRLGLCTEATQHTPLPMICFPFTH